MVIFLIYKNNVFRVFSIWYTRKKLDVMNELHIHKSEEQAGTYVFLVWIRVRKNILFLGEDARQVTFSSQMLYDPK